MAQVTITVKTESEVEAAILKAAMQKIADNMTSENIKLLAEKSAKPGINDKLQKFKHMI